MKINWKVRFSKDNLTFIFRFMLSLTIPILTYLNLEPKDITSWEILKDVVVNFVSSPYLLGLTITNAIILIPDPTTKGISDSQLVLDKTKKGKGGIVWKKQ